MDFQYAMLKGVVNKFLTNETVCYHTCFYGANIITDSKCRKDK